MRFDKGNKMDAQAADESQAIKVGEIDCREAVPDQTVMAETPEPDHKPHALPHPSRLRLAALLVLAVYPLITTLLYIVMPLTTGWDTWHRTLVLTPIMVLSIVFIVIPAIQRHFGWYVARLPRPRSQRV